MDQADRVGVNFDKNEKSRQHGCLGPKKVQKMEEYRTYAHTPPHLYRAGAKYFITASTFENKRLFDDAVKEKLFSSLLKSCVNHGWSLEDWVILDNHYHIMVNAPELSANPAKFVSEYHRFTAPFILFTLKLYI